MGSIDALALAIKEFEGGVVIVSHDFRAYRADYFAHYLVLIMCFPFSWTRSHFASRRRSLGSQGQNCQQSHKGRHHYRRLQEESHSTE